MKIITSNINPNGLRKRSRQSSITEEKTHGLHKSFDQGQSQEAVQTIAEKVSTIAIATQDGVESKTNINRAIDQDTNRDTSRLISESHADKAEKSLEKEEIGRLNEDKMTPEMEQRLEPAGEMQETLGQEGTKTLREASAGRIQEGNEQAIKFRFGSSANQTLLDVHGKT